ncbi:MAG TPA: permease-like cell division protein FtsX [Abditibacterium sp.]|jgi:cell division transport system permease protein
MEFLQFWTRETFANIRRNRLMSLLAISTVTVALFILGAFYLSISNLRAAVGAQARQLDLVVILDKNIDAARRSALFEAARMPQVEKVDIVLASQALKELKKRYADLPLDDFANDNPLGDELRVRLKNPDDFFKVRAYLGSLRGVSAIQDAGADVAARKLLDFNRFLGYAAATSLVILGLAILLIIHNAIRLTVFARRREIRIMRLVGATSGFIRVPFLLEGVVYGLSGAILAALALSALYGAALGNPAPLVKSILPLSPGQILGPCIGLMLVAGLFFGVVGAYLSFSHSQRNAEA